MRFASFSAALTVHLLVAIGCSQPHEPGTSRSRERLPVTNDREEIRRRRCPECQRLAPVVVPAHTRSDDGWKTVLDLAAGGLAPLRDRGGARSETKTAW